MRRLFNGDTAPPTTKPRIKLKYLWLAIILAAIALLTGSFLVWYHISGFTFKREQTNLTVYVTPTDEKKTAIEEIYCIPESTGFKATDRGTLDISVITEYIGDDQQIIFMQGLATSTSHVDTEGNSIVPISFQEYDGYYVQMNDELLLSWVMDGYVFYIIGNIEKQEAIDLAQTVTVEE